MATPPSTLGPGEEVEHPEFTTDRIALDLETAIDEICETLKGVTPTETDEGVKCRTTDGMLIAILTQVEGEDEAVDLYYRTAPESETATLKARRLGRALEPYAE